MKELSIKEKAKRYDETLKAAVVAHKDEDRHLKAVLKRIFPELKESEDEKIRKALIDYFDDADKADENPLQSYGIHTDKAIAWLEEQGDKKPVIEGTFVNVDEVREDFMKEVYRFLDDDSNNDKANQIIDAFDNLPTIDF